MNRKIFTLLASALMLFSTAFYVNAQRIVAEKSVGDLVKTLSGSGPGMYHIQIDSLRLPQNGGTWYPVTYDGGTISNGYFQYDATKGGGLNYTLNTVSLPGDTMILSVTEDGRVAMISASDLRHNFAAGKAFLTDLQATMWCINVLKDGSKGEWPTFHFTNKVFGQDLDWMNADETLLRGNDRGWMYSPSYLNGDLKSKMTLHRHEADSVGKYRVITAELNANGRPTGLLETRIVDIGEYIADTLSGMLKFSIVKISPFVMTADDFNSELGNTDGTGTVKLKFVPNPDVAPTSFTQNLRADSSNNIDARRLGYLNVKAYHEDGKIEGYIANSNQTKTDDTLKYNNKSSVEYLNLSAVEVEDETIMQNDNGNYNYSYRFVYFPSEDSLVINAYYAKHDLHNTYASNAYIDDDPYLPDAPGVKQFYYGLYNDTIHDYLIVRLQDLNKGAEHLLTVGEHPANVRISFGINSCNEEADAWKVSEGVYTIWDKRGRCLGVRIYNGSYSPQWIDLDEGECPDRIPSYQWVVEHSDLSSVGRINLHNREFGDLRPGAQNEDTFVDILNVLVKKNKEYQIFKHKRLFQYSPIIRNLQALYEYEPIINAYVKGQLLPVVNPQSDATCGIKAESGFRPVWNAFVQDQYLGYKHFCVNTDPNSPSFGKSDNVGKAKGMDYNAYAFNYLYYATDDAYIGSELSYDDNILNVSRTDKLGFQFMLGANLRANKYQEETFGYPRTAWSAREIYDQNGNKVVYTQTSVPVLKRYYYELKVADFYNYRDGLAEEYVVLKGEKIDGSKP
ncbi:MAG: hypothetical protein LBH90_07420, partial [Tannerella sp.]|nr:hypothetical protein [Tannerella sp.]